MSKYQQRKNSRKKILRVKILAQNQVFSHFLKFASLVFLDVAQDSSFGQCLASCRIETCKKDLTNPNQGQIRFSSVFFLLYFNFMPIYYKELFSPTTLLLPSLSIGQFNDLQSNSKWNPCNSRYIEIFSIFLLWGVQQNLLMHCFCFLSIG